MQRVIRVRELGPEVSTHMQNLQELTHRAVRGEACENRVWVGSNVQQASDKNKE